MLTEPLTFLFKTDLCGDLCAVEEGGGGPGTPPNARITEEGEGRVTEEGDIRVTED